MRVLVSAYSCEPNQGSESGAGWNTAVHLAQRHDVWVLTRSNNRSVIEAQLQREPVPRLTPVYYDLPPAVRWWKRGRRGVEPYYYLWQLGAYRYARKLHADVDFQVAHHVTFIRYWSPSFIALLPVPFVWGPVGGADSTPRAFLRGLSWRGKVLERTRNVVRSAAELDPCVRLTARRSAAALANTRQTLDRLRNLGATDVRICSDIGLTKTELDHFAQFNTAQAGPAKFLSVGRLVHWKGFHLGIDAFAAAGLPDAQYHIVGDGPERARLYRRARDLGVAGQVRFLGSVPRQEVFRSLQEAHALIHPSLHDSGGWVCVEAMAAATPVLCLALGGPREQVTPECGFVVPADDPTRAVEALAEAIRQVSADGALRQAMGASGRRRAETYAWPDKIERLDRLYADLVR